MCASVIAEANYKVLVTIIQRNSAKEFDRRLQKKILLKIITNKLCVLVFERGLTCRSDTKPVLLPSTELIQLPFINSLPDLLSIFNELK